MKTKTTSYIVQRFLPEGWVGWSGSLGSLQLGREHLRKYLRSFEGATYPKFCLIKRVICDTVVK
jgi:hypothetical protein